MTIRMIGQAVTGFQYAPANLRIVAELDVPIFHATKILPHLEKHGRDFVFFENGKNTVGIAAVWAIVEGQHQGLRRQTGAKDFIAFRFGFTARFSAGIVQRRQ